MTGHWCLQLSSLVSAGLNSWLKGGATAVFIESSCHPSAPVCFCPFNTLRVCYQPSLSILWETNFKLFLILLHYSYSFKKIIINQAEIQCLYGLFPHFAQQRTLLIGEINSLKWMVVFCLCRFWKQGWLQWWLLWEAIRSLLCVKANASWLQDGPTAGYHQWWW